ncbi:DNA internalization-related competence protein ComEC/Rec2 [Candidatus Omnitrophota bacterium]
MFFVIVSCGLFLVAALASLQKKVLFSISLSLAVLLAGSLHLSNSQIYPANHISNFVSNKGQEVSLIGRVASNPETSQTFYHSQKSSFTLRVNALKVEDKWQPIAGLVKATLYGQRRVAYGDQLLLEGSLARPPGLRNPGGFNYREYLANHNIFGLLKVKEKDTFQVISSKKDSSVVRHIFKFKQKLHSIIYRHLEPEQAALLSAILLGERSELSQDIKDLFISTGTIHILAISGLHVGLIAFIIIMLLRALRLKLSVAYLLTIFCLVIYAGLSGMRPAVTRATIMVSVVLCGLLINRETKIYNSLGLAALIILVANPRMLFDVGFQLSFLSVISIAYFSPRIVKFFPEQQGWRRYLAQAFSVSLAAWLGLAPLIAYYFNIVTPVAILANLIIIPLLLLVVATGFTLLVSAQISGFLAGIFANSCWLSLTGLTKAAFLFSRMPLSSFYLPKPGALFGLSYYTLLLLIFNYQRLNLSKGKLAIVLAVTANFLVWPPLFKPASDNLSVTFLDVGHGDAIFIELPGTGGNILVDGGPGQENDAGRRVILPFLRNRGINQIDVVILTHPDDDHLGGLASVLKNINVSHAFDNGMTKRSSVFKAYQAAVKQRAVNYQILKQGDQISGFSKVGLFVLHPPEPLLSGTDKDINNNSLVLKLVYKDISLLLCGDIQCQAIPYLLALSPMLPAAIIKIPHHGSDEGQIERSFLDQVAARFAVISADRNARFGFPRPRIVEQLVNTGAQVFNTGEHGAVTVVTDGRDIWIETMTDAEAGI